jgi:hypothetical protein
MILVYINDADNSGWSSRLASDVKTGIVIETEAPTVAIPLHVTILSVRLHPSKQHTSHCDYVMWLWSLL